MHTNLLHIKHIQALTVPLAAEATGHGSSILRRKRQAELAVFLQRTNPLMLSWLSVRASRLPISKYACVFVKRPSCGSLEMPEN